MYPLPVASVHVVPEVGADARLNTNPEVTMVALDPLEGVVVGVNDIVGVIDIVFVIDGVIDGVTDIVLVTVMLGVKDGLTVGVIDIVGVIVGVTDIVGVGEGLGNITLFNRVTLTYPDPVLKYPKLLMLNPLNAEDLSYKPFELDTNIAEAVMKDPPPPPPSDSVLPGA